MVLSSLIVPTLEKNHHEYKDFPNQMLIMNLKKCYVWIHRDICAIKYSA